MTKTKLAFVLLGVMNLILILMHLTGYFILFFRQTGYMIPLAVDIIILAILGFRSSRYSNRLIIAGLFLSVPFLLMLNLWVQIRDYSYKKIDSPHGQQSLIIEYRDFTLGETTYYYHFYKTIFGFVGKRLDDQSIEMVNYDRGIRLTAEEALGLGREQWITKNIVRFPTWEGMKDIHLAPSRSPVSSADIEAFINMAKNKKNGRTLTVNGNQLEIRYDEMSGQSWIEVTSDGVIPRQQCSRIVPNEESQFYMLEECTHRWEYPLYPMTEGK
ncbi:MULTISPECIES: hypothetical protein [Bacillaceae]|uniref:hypothetical protein n=1 Tax=Bacillaceae TaxID=186817 RepID=UPI0016018AF2|nr:hypothetical protein [Bacillus sp. PK3_68]